MLGQPMLARRRTKLDGRADPTAAIFHRLPSALCGFSRAAASRTCPHSWRSKVGLASRERDGDQAIHRKRGAQAQVGHHHLRIARPPRVGVAPYMPRQIHRPVRRCSPRIQTSDSPLLSNVVCLQAAQLIIRSDPLTPAAQFSRWAPASRMLLGVAVATVGMHSPSHPCQRGLPPSNDRAINFNAGFQSSPKISRLSAVRHLVRVRFVFCHHHAVGGYFNHVGFGVLSSRCAGSLANPAFVRDRLSAGPTTHALGDTKYAISPGPQSPLLMLQKRPRLCCFAFWVRAIAARREVVNSPATALRVGSPVRRGRYRVAI